MAFLGVSLLLAMGGLEDEVVASTEEPYHALRNTRNIIYHKFPFNAVLCLLGM